MIIKKESISTAVIKNNPKVTIIILNCYNEWRDTIECLESIYKITYPNWELILVDNGSADGSVSKIKEWAVGKIPVESKFFEYDKEGKPIDYIEELLYDEEEARVKILKKEKELDTLLPHQKLSILRIEKNRGFTGGNNIGIEYIIREKKTDYILLLNNDTVVDGNFLTELVKVAESDPKIGIVGPKILNYYDGAIDFCGGKINWWLGRPYHIKREYCGKTDFITGCCMLIKRQLIEKGFVFDNVYFIYFEDADLCEQVKRNGYTLEITNKAVINHKISKSFRKQGEKSDFSIYLFARNILLFNKRYNKNKLKYSIFLFFQYILKTIAAYFVFNENQFRSWLKGLSVIEEGEQGQNDALNNEKWIFL